MYLLQISIHARPTGHIATYRRTLGRRELAVLQPDADQIALPMVASFEQAAQHLACLPRMFVEPDGSFVWVGEERHAHWQLEGCLYDRHHRLLYVDVKGSCPPNQFDRFLATFGWPAQRLMFQLTREAVYLDERDFRQYAACADD